MSLVAHNKLFYCFTHFSNCHLKIYAIKLKLVLCPVTGTKKIHVNLVWPGVLGIQEFVCLFLIKHTECTSKLHIF